MSGSLVGCAAGRDYAIWNGVPRASATYGGGYESLEATRLEMDWYAQ